MAVTDSVADLLASIRNGQQARLAEIDVPASKMRKGVLEVLKQEGFIRDHQDIQDERGLPRIKISLKYDRGEPVIKNMKKVSKPGRREYANVETLPRVYNGLGVAIISSSKGIISDHQARIDHVGGEVLCTVF